MKTSDDDNDDGGLLASLLTDALGGLEFEFWGFYFPFLMATWRFIRARRTGVLDELDATFADPPTFRGRGAKWFCEHLATDDGFLDREEKIMHWIASRIPEKAKRRGCLAAAEVPIFDLSEMREVAHFILSLVDRDKQRGLLKT